MTKYFQTEPRSKIHPIVPEMLVSPPCRASPLPSAPPRWWPWTATRGPVRAHHVAPPVSPNTRLGSFPIIFNCGGEGNLHDHEQNVFSLEVTGHKLYSYYASCQKRSKGTVWDNESSKMLQVCNYSYSIQESCRISRRHLALRATCIFLETRKSSPVETQKLANTWYLQQS